MSTYRDQADEIATLRQELATSETACASAMAKVDALREERDNAIRTRNDVREQRDTWRTMHHEVEAERDALKEALAVSERNLGLLIRAATHLVQLVDHGADTVAIGGAIPALRRALDGGGQ